MFAKIFYSLIFILLPLCGANSYGQEVASEKRELIRELLVVMEAGKTATAIMDSMTDQMQKDILARLNRATENDRSLTPAQRAARQRASTESAQRSADRFRELFKQRVNYGQLVEELSYEVYDKYLTADELRYLLTFYKSETGQKITRILPQITSESMMRFSERLTPVLEQIMQEILEEEQDRIESTSPVNKVMPGKRRGGGGARRRP